MGKNNPKYMGENRQKMRKKEPKIEKNEGNNPKFEGKKGTNK